MSEVRLTYRRVVLELKGIALGDLDGASCLLRKKTKEI